MELSQTFQNLAEGFVNTQAESRNLDERTMKAYQQDLELFFRWLELNNKKETAGFKAAFPLSISAFLAYDWEEEMEDYLEYLSKERGLRFSTVCRKYQVFGYFLSYMKAEGMIKGFRPLKLPDQQRQASVDTFLTKQEVDAFFRAIHQEYSELETDFRRRVCLRDQIMMELLFYHRIEVSELLRMEVSDYDRKTAVLVIRRKREKERTVSLFSHALQKQMEQWLAVHEYFEHEGLYHNRMFLSKFGKPLSMKMIINIFEKYRVLAGIEKACTPKDLKNSLGRYGEELVREMGQECLFEIKNVKARLSFDDYPSFFGTNKREIKNGEYREKLYADL